MANFQPMKDRFLVVLGENLRLCGAGGRFLDYGCGRGDVAEYLIRGGGFTEGLAYDPSVTAGQESSSGPREGGRQLAYRRTLPEARGDFDVAVLFDVIEHVPEPARVLEDIRAQVKPGGWLAVTVPYNPHEWGVDDDFYGHLRRLSMRGVVSMLEAGGWGVIRALDPSFPSFWFIRRVYLMTRRFLRQPIPAGADVAGTDMHRSLASSRQSAWDTGGPVQRMLSGGLLPWKLIRRFDLYFESIFRGFELFILCRKREGEASCGVCGCGRFVYHRFFHRYSLQRCTYCETEKILAADSREAGSDGLRPSPVHGLIRRWRARRVRRLAGRASGAMVAVVRNPAEDIDLAELQAGGREVRCLGLPEWLAAPAQSCAVVALFHVIELAPEVDMVLDRLDAAVAHGGHVLLEYPNSGSWLKRAFRWRWFGYDPPNHRHIVDSRKLCDRMGLRNYHLVRERHFAPEYSFFIFIQTLINVLLSFQRDALYRWLRGVGTSPVDRAAAWLSIPLAVLLAPLFVIYQPLASWFRRGCVVQQVYRRTDIASASQGGGA